MIGYTPFLAPIQMVNPAPLGLLVPRKATGQSSLSQISSGDAVPLGNVLLGLLGAASIGLSAYHGYKRNNSTGWAIWWGLMGALFPVITPAIAFAQGFGKRAK